MSEGKDRPEPGENFATRLDWLFRNRQDPQTMKPYRLREVAAHLGCSHTHVLDLRTGKATPNVDEIAKLARCFGVPIAWLANIPAPDGSQVELHDELTSTVLRDPNIRAVAARMAERPLSPQGIQTLLEILRNVQDLEASYRPRPRRSARSDDETPA